MTARRRWLIGACLAGLLVLAAPPAPSAAGPGCVDLAIRGWAVRLVPNEADVRLQLRLAIVNWGAAEVHAVPELTGSWRSPRGGAATALAPWSLGTTEGLQPDGMSELQLEVPECWWLPYPRSEYVITVRIQSPEDAYPSNNTLQLALDEVAVRGLVHSEMGVWGPEGQESWLYGQVVGLRHTQNSSWLPWESTLLDGTGKPDGMRELRSADLGSPLYCGFDWWTPDQVPCLKAEDLYLPPGVVLGFCSTNMILDRAVQAPYLEAHRAQAGALQGADGSVVLRRLIGPDLGAPEGTGYAWYETTEEGYEGQWDLLADDLEALPRGTVLVLRHSADAKHRVSDPCSAGCEGYFRQWRLPAGGLGLSLIHI